MRIPASVFLVLLLTGGAVPAQDAAKPEADACATFAWPLAREQAWFSSSDLPALASGARLPTDRPAILLELKPFAEAALPHTPSREPKPGTYAGYVQRPAAPTPGEIQVTLSGEGWIDVMTADGTVLKSGLHSGRKGCANLRTSVRFQVEAKPLIIAISNAADDTVRLAVTPVR